jgi:hypothetical protein
MSGAALLDRVQTGGPGQINIGEERIYEVGNLLSVGKTTDTPDLTFNLETFDPTSETEAIITHVDTTSFTPGQEFDLNDAQPFDIISPWQGDGSSTSSVGGAVIPYLNLENATYRAGVRQSVQKTFTLRSDALYVAGLTPYWQEFAAAGVGPYVFTNTAVETTETGDTIFALCVTLYHTDGTYERLFFGANADYTNTSGGFTLTATGAAKLQVGTTLEAVYFSSTPRTLLQADHPDTTEKPAAVRHQTVDVYISDGGATPILIRQGGLQNFEANRRVTLDRDEELGSAHAVAISYDIPDVSGTMTMRPATVAYMIARLEQLSGVDTGKVINAVTRTPLEMEIQISHPDTGDRIQTWYTPDAKFTLPGIQPRANTKLELQIPWSSESGTWLVYEGERP